MFNRIFGRKPIEETPHKKWRRTTPQATVLTKGAIRAALRNQTITIPRGGKTIHAKGFSITIEVKPNVVGGNVTAQISPTGHMRLPANIGTLILKRDGHDPITHMFGSTGKAEISGVVAGTYRLSLS